MLVVLAGCVVVAEGGGRGRREEGLRWLRVKGNIGILIFFCIYFVQRMMSMVHGNT